MSNWAKTGLFSAFVHGIALSQGHLAISSKSIRPTDSFVYSYLGISLSALEFFLSEVHQRPISDLGVKQALKETEALLQRATHFRVESNRGVTTFVLRGSDVLLTRYEVSGVESITSIYVFDWPGDSVLLIPYQPAAVSSADNVRSFINRVVRWEGFQAGLDVSLVFDPATKSLSGYGLSTSAIRRRFDFLSFLIGNQNYLVWRCDKTYFQNVFSPETNYLPERFPPLAERLRTHSTAELLSMLPGAGEAPYSPSSRRNDVIARELLQRGISTDEFTRMLLPVRASNNRIRRRAESIARAIVNSPKTSAFEVSARSVLAGLDPASARSEAAVDGILSELRRNTQVDLTMTMTACLLLRQKRFIRPVLSYLGLRGHTKEDFDCVKSADIGPEFETDKQFALMQIQQSQRR
jgi:hypothetical protein